MALLNYHTTFTVECKRQQRQRIVSQPTIEMIGGYNKIIHSPSKIK